MPDGGVPTDVDFELKGIDLIAFPDADVVNAGALGVRPTECPVIRFLVYEPRLGGSTGFWSGICFLELASQREFR